MPDLAKVAVTFLPEFKPFWAEKETAAGGIPFTDQVYRSRLSPALFAPSTLKLAVVPVTGLGDDAAAVTIVGGDCASIKRHSSIPCANEVAPR